MRIARVEAEVERVPQREVEEGSIPEVVVGVVPRSEQQTVVAAGLPQLSPRIHRLSFLQVVREDGKRTGSYIPSL